MTSVMVGVLGVIGLLALLLLRMPIAVAMILVSTVGYGYITRPTAALAKLGGDAFGTVSSYSLSVIPLFIFMGLLLSYARLGRELYDFFHALIGRLSGGLGMATIGASALFASVSGSAVGTASTMATVTVPEMRKYKYHDGLAASCAAVGGTLGILIPPSAALVLYGVLTEEPIGRILLAGILPGVMTALILMFTVYLIARLRPELAPRAEVGSGHSAWRAFLKIWPVPLIFGISMGGIYGGVFTPTEAGGVGAFLSLAFAVLTGRLPWSMFVAAVSQTARLTAMILFVVIGGKMFGSFLTLTRIPLEITGFISELTLAPILVIFFIFFIYFILGMFMDEIAILVIMTPIMYPIVIELGYDGAWFGVLTIMMLLTGLLTPPVGLIAFIVSSITKIPVGTIFVSLTPFWFALIVAAALVIAFPQIPLLIPDMMR